LTGKRPAVEAGICPAFDTGCPFKEVRDMEALRHKLQKLPSSHGGQSPSVEGEVGSLRSPAHSTLVEMLQMMHQASQNAKEAVGGDCPVFQAACPFKNCVTSGGMPLWLALESRSWGQIIHDSHDTQEASTPAPTTEPSSAAPIATAATSAPGSAPAALGPGPVAAVEDEDGQGLARKLKLGTTEAHKAAETVHFVREFIKGKVPRDVYAQMMSNLYYVYEAMEEALETCCEHPLVEDLHFPDELSRAETLARDAEYFAGPDWRERLPASPVTLEYVQRLKEIAAESPELIIPHAYTRYLGDLSGGQLLRKAAVRGMRLPDDGSGVQFYIFRRIKDHKKFKDMYRARLDNLKADVEMADRMVVEANLAFGLNTRMFQELDKLMGFELPAEPLPPLPGPEQRVPGALIDAAATAAAAACPFAALAAIGMEMPADHPPTQATAAEHEALKKVGGSARVAAKAELEGGIGRWLRHPMAGAVVCAVWAAAVAWALGLVDF